MYVPPPSHQTLFDPLTAKHTAFVDFTSMINAEGGYRPSFYVDGKDPAAQRDLIALADAYDAVQSERGDSRRAFRVDFGAIRAIPDADVLAAMLKYGGGFVKSLASAGQIADRDNLRRLKNAFPEYWERYSRMAANDELSEP